MPIHILRLPAAEAVGLLRAETETAHGQPELNTSAWKEYVIKEELHRDADETHQAEDYDRVTSIATLNIEPRLERDYWVLKVVVERRLGLVKPRDEDALARMDMTLDEFEAELRSPGRKRMTVRLAVETAAAKRHFDHWLAEMRSRHPGKKRTKRRRAAARVQKVPTRARI